MTEDDMAQFTVVDIVTMHLIKTTLIDQSEVLKNGRETAHPRDRDIFLNSLLPWLRCVLCLLCCCGRFCCFIPLLKIDLHLLHRS